MSLNRFLIVGAWIASVALALDLHAAEVAAKAVSMSAEQARALGVRVSPVPASPNLEVGTHARVVFKTDAQYVIAAPYAGIVQRVLVSVGQAVRPGQAVAIFASPQLYEASRALTEANSQAHLAQQSLARDRALYDDGIIAASRISTHDSRRQTKG